MSMLEANHHPALRSGVASANGAETDFPIQNLPFGRMRRGNQPWRIGDYTDFDVGIHHATAVGRLFRPHNPLRPHGK